MTFFKSLVISAAVHVSCLLLVFILSASMKNSTVEFKNPALTVSASLHYGGTSHAVLSEPRHQSESNGYTSGEEEQNIIKAASAVKAIISELSVNRPPSYPLFCRRNSIEGEVVLAIEIRRDGKVGSISVRSFSGSSLFAKAALEAASEWDITTGQTGLSHDFTVLQKIAFRLKD